MDFAVVEQTAAGTYNEQARTVKRIVLAQEPKDFSLCVAEMMIRTVARSNMSHTRFP